jgi:hypothetical protein
MIRPKNKWIVWGISIFNALLMLAFSLYWLNLPYTFGDEAFLIKWSSLLKKSLLQIDPKPNPEEVLFVDVSGNKTVIDGVNEFGDKSPYNRIVITDREQLSQFFSLLNRYRHEVRFVLCDVLFAESSPADSLLQVKVDSLGDKLLGVSHLDKSGKHTRPVIRMPYAVSTYNATQGLFLKYPLMLSDSLKTLPLVMYEKLNGARFEYQKGWLFYQINGRRSLHAPIIDFKLRQSDFKVGQTMGEANFAVWPMGTILESQEFMDEESMRAFFKGKMVVIGDFINDVHRTPFEKLPGLVLLYNAYLTLVSGENALSGWWLAFLFAGYLLLSYRIFFDLQVIRPAWLVKVSRSKFWQAVVNTADELTILTVITFLSYFIFHRHINILILLIYLKIVEYLWKKSPVYLQAKMPQMFKRKPKVTS